MTKLWGGRFEGGLDPFFAGFNRSLGFDCRLLEYDVLGSIAWARALGRAGVLAGDEAQRLEAALTEILDDLREREVVEIDSDAEDVHAYVEELLEKRVGVLARKLHTGRSRNDQVATDLKLALRDSLAELTQTARELMTALVELADRYAGTPMPGYTHLQRAQPITIGHHALAYVEMLARDAARLDETAERLETCPLGSGALAGTAFAIDRERLAEELGFERGPTANSLDAVSDRDHVCDTLYACATILAHLSRLAEDWIFFASYEAGFLRLADAVATGSSLMPQKKNPDALELIRGKAGRVAGHLHAMLTTLKGLPLAYDKDLQEDKEGLFDAIDTTLVCMRVATTVVRTSVFDEDRCRAEASRGYLNATDLADLLVEAGVPFRDAHERTGRAVLRALERDCELQDLPQEDRVELLPELDDAAFARLNVDAVLARRAATGGTAPARVRERVAAWKKRLET